MFLTEKNEQSIVIPNKLYGRESELEQIEAHFNDRGSITKLLLIKASSGIGKSSLVKAFAHDITSRENVLFFSGENDTAPLNHPYESVIKAFSQLIDYWINQDVGNELEDVFIKHLSDHSSIISLLFPKIAHYFTEEKDNNPHIKNQGMVTEALLSLVQAIESLEQTIILFFDDLHWADSSISKFLNAVLSESQLKNLFFIGAYDSDELDDNQFVLEAMKSDKMGADKIQELHLKALGLSQIYELVEDVFKLEERGKHSVSEFLLQSTGGNPLYLKMALPSLVSKGDLVYTGKWGFDKTQSHLKVNGSRSEEFIFGKIAAMPAFIQDCLSIGAAVGYSFSSTVVAAVLGKSFQEVNNALLFCVDQQLLVSGENGERSTAEMRFFFKHRKIQMTSYLIMNNNRKEWVHYTIGKTYDNSLGYAASGRNIIDIVNHYNRCKSQFTADNERKKLMKMNFSAALRTKEMGGYDQAINYLNTIISLCTEEKKDSSLIDWYSVYFELGAAYYLSGNFVESLEYFSTAIKYSLSEINNSKVYYYYLLIYAKINDFESAWSYGLKALKYAGLSIPYNISKIKAITLYLRIKSKMSRISPEEFVNRAKLNDENIEHQLLILMQMMAAAWSMNRQSLAYIILKGLELMLKHGVSPIGHFAVSGYGSLLGLVTGKPIKGWPYVKVGAELTKGYEHSSLYGRGSIGVYGVYSHFVIPIKDNLAPIIQVYNSAKKTGDYDIAAHASLRCVENHFLADENVQNVIIHAKTYLGFLLRSRNYNYYLLNKGIVETLETLRFGLEKSEHKLKRIDARMEMVDQSHIRFGWYVHQIMSAVILNDKFRMKKYLALLLEIKYQPMSMVSLIHHVYFASSIVELYPDWVGDKKELKSQLNKTLKLATKYARSNPDNYDQILFFLKGLIAELNKDLVGAEKHYREASRLSQQYFFKQFEAFFLEKLARILLKKNNKSAGITTMRESRDLYLSWGADWKADRLTKEFPL